MTFRLILKGRKKNLRPKAYLLDRVYLPKSSVEMLLAKKHYDRRIYFQKGCNRCPVYKEGNRFCDICAGCDNFKGRYVTYEVVEIGNTEYVAFPAGSVDAVFKNLQLRKTDFNIQDNRCDAKAKNPLKFTGQLYDGTQIINGYPVANQKQIVKDFSKFKRGLIEAPARSGKTILAAAIFCGAKRTTLYMAHEKQLLLQFYKTILKFTNLRELRTQTGKKIVGIIEKESDWLEDWDLVLVNNQKFITDMGIERIRKHVIKRFGQLMCDECHRSAARAYMNTINRIDAKRKVGFSATLTRKDGLQFLMNQMLGELAAKGVVELRPPRVEIVDTKITTTKKFAGRAGYTYANMFLAQNKERLKLIIKTVFRDLRENPLHSIIMPVMFKGQAAQLARMINAQAQYNNSTKGERWPLLLAHPYFDDKSINKTEVLNSARQGDIRVIIAIRKMVKEGIDVPRWTHMYLTVPMNNEEDFYQTTARINTPYEGKPQSVLKIFVDDIGLSLGCFKPTYFNGVLKRKYLVDDENRETAERLIAKTEQKATKRQHIEEW